MIQEEFLAIAALNPTQVNVWYTQTVPYTILGVTVPTTNPAGENIIGYLQEATQMTLEVNEDSFVTLNLLQRSLLGDVPTQYYYFITSPEVIQDVGNSQVSPGQLIFTPGINGAGFQQGGYNALQGLAENIRQSDYIMQADRISYINTGAGLPTNINQLEANNATRARIQDSMYSSTGWISARYEGTKLDSSTNLGADPALQGTFFEGVLFSINADDSTIQQLASVGAVTYEELFFSGTGTGDIPKCKLINTYLETTVDFTSNNDYVLKLNSYPLNINLWPKPGDILTITPEPGAIGEFYKMIRQPASSDDPYLYRENTTFDLWLGVQRGYNNSPRDNNIYGGAGVNLYKITPTKIYKLANNLVQPVRQGKLIVKGTDDVLYIDVNGFVIGAVGGSSDNPVPTIIE